MKYHPVRYRSLKNTIDIARSQHDAVMRELAMKHGVGTRAFNKAASALVDGQIEQSIDFKELLVRKQGMDKVHVAWEQGESVVLA